ncbi:Cytochrome P450 2J6 [Hypsibius exemplaris]|uniref:Cytochrome P450 2J6 n=1 Tax=Hypsibius exemplaris TaxID=2072580 RepID=A0A1W0WSS6_HYPEX|nr:Cytochrome P450 2J6 [Hypsibius exemplaris]
METTALISPFLLKILLLAGGTFLAWKWATRKRTNYPPGPRNIPVLGCTWALDHKSPITTFSQWAKQYGRYYYCKLGKDNVVVVNDPALVRSLFANENCTNRPEVPGARFRKEEAAGHCGLIFAEGLEWKEHRRFVLRSLKDLGVGKRSIEDKVAEEAEYLTSAFRNTNGQPFDNKVPVSTSVANVIANIVWDERYEIGDPVFQELMDSVFTLFRTSFASAMLGSYIWLRYVPYFSGVFAAFDRCAKTIAAYFWRKTEEHLATWQPQNDRDMMDAYISSMKQNEFKTFEAKQMSFMVEDLMEAGFETTATGLRWAFLLMCAHPEIQKKVQAELDANIHDGATIKPADKANLPYTEAVIAEMQRWASFVPFGVMHAVEKDMDLDGYTLHAGTWILPNLYFIHHDEKLWKDPFEFRPERFLSAKGEFSEPDTYMPFSVGRRKCPGETLARIELLVFFGTILKEMTLSLPPGVAANLQPLPGATLDAAKHSLIAVPRKR